MSAHALADRVAEVSWYQSLRLPGGIVTAGSFDTGAELERLPFPAALEGKRCLDVGTADGFWAFEMERRGAADVLATDVDSYFQQKSRVNFEHARDLRASRVRYEVRSVFDLDGEWDVAFMGYVLQMF